MDERPALKFMGIVALLVTLNLVGITYGIFLVEYLDPNFQDNYRKAMQQPIPGYAQLLESRHFSYWMMGYLPFAFSSLALALFSYNRVSIPKTFLPKLKKLCSVAIFVLTIFLLASGPNYLMGQRGLQVSETDVIAFMNTPIALSLLIIGSMGMLILALLPHQHNPTWKAWLKLVIGFGIVILASMWMEVLLMLSYPKI